jgi:hypothetical protein
LLSVSSMSKSHSQPVTPTGTLKSKHPLSLPVIPTIITEMFDEQADQYLESHSNSRSHYVSDPDMLSQQLTPIKGQCSSSSMHELTSNKNELTSNTSSHVIRNSLLRFDSFPGQDQFSESCLSFRRSSDVRLHSVSPDRTPTNSAHFRRHSALSVSPNRPHSRASVYRNGHLHFGLYSPERTPTNSAHYRHADVDFDQYSSTVSLKGYDGDTDSGLFSDQHTPTNHQSYQFPEPGAKSKEFPESVESSQPLTPTNLMPSQRRSRSRSRSKERERLSQTDLELDHVIDAMFNFSTHEVRCP